MKTQRKRADDPELSARKSGADRGRRQIEQGKGVAHGKVREWLLGLAAGKKKPRPTCA